MSASASASSSGGTSRPRRQRRVPYHRELTGEEAEGLASLLKALRVEAAAVPDREKGEMWASWRRHRFVLEDAHALRFLRARNFDAEAAAEQMARTLLWRESEGIDDLVPEEHFPSVVDHGLFFHAGNTDDGRPVMAVFPGLHTPGRFDHKELVLKFAYTLDRMFETVPAGHDPRVVFVHDRHCFSRANFDLAIFKEMSSTLADYFPETLSEYYITRCNLLFRTLWPVVKPFLDGPTRKKVHPVFGDGRDQLSEFMTLDKIWRWWGGEVADRDVGVLGYPDLVTLLGIEPPPENDDEGDKGDAAAAASTSASSSD